MYSSVNEPENCEMGSFGELENSYSREIDEKMNLKKEKF